VSAGASVHIPGWTADWLPGWLAGVGLAVLVPRANLSWDPDSAEALVSHPDAHNREDFARLLLDHLPTKSAAARLSIAKASTRRRDLSWHPSRAAFSERAALARHLRDFVLEGAHSDLAPSVRNEIANSDFYAGGPGTIGGLHDRYVRSLAFMQDAQFTAAQVAQSFEGRPVLQPSGGLGFDPRRLTNGSNNGPMTTDPVVEVCCFHALKLFPVRGNGARVSTRGWIAVSGFRRAEFHWLTWEAPLERWGIDALLDQAYSDVTARNSLRRLGVTHMFRTSQYRKRGSESNEAFASLGLW
jgi:hypothetical protein